MTVKVTTADGVYLVWSTVPAAINPRRGDRVRFTATLSRGRDSHFAFGKRPSKASIL